MLNFLRRLLTLLSGIGYALFGVGLGGLFFAAGVNTTVAIAMVIVGVLFFFIAFVFDTILDYINEKGS